MTVVAGVFSAVFFKLLLLFLLYSMIPEQINKQDWLVIPLYFHIMPLWKGNGLVKAREFRYDAGRSL